MEDKKNFKPIKASVEKPSFAKELARDAYRNIIEPKTNQIMHDMFSSFLSMLGDVGQEGLNKAFHTNGTRVNNNSSSNGNTNYATFYTKPASASNVIDLGKRDSTQVQYVYVNTEEDAQTLVSQLQQNIAQYGKAKVADLYQMVNISPVFTDYKFGWTNANDIGYHKVYTGEHANQYMIDLARPISISNV